MMTEPTCPNCGSIDAYYNADCYDMEDLGDCFIKYIITTCPKCQTIYKWKEIFNFSHIEDLTED